jgi:ribosomal subunit interface protein
MKVRVSGKQLQIGEALPELVRTRLEVVVAKRFKGGAEASVVFSHEGSGFRADISAHVDSGAVLKAEAVDTDIHRALDAAIDRFETQLRRYTRRLKNHHEKAKASRDVGA